MEHESNVSIVEVAALARVSTATVSRVLSGRRTKDDDIARHVREAAKTLNYEANYAASALRSDVTKSIGLLVETATDTFTGQMMDALEQAAGDQDRQLILAVGVGTESRRQRVTALLSRHIDGLIVLSGGHQQADTNQTEVQTDAQEATAFSRNSAEGHTDLAEQTQPGTKSQPKNRKFTPANTAGPDDFISAHTEIPVVQISGDRPLPHSSWVGVDDSATMRQAIDHLLGLNAKCIAFLGDPPSTMSAATLFTTFQSMSEILDIYTEPEWSTFGAHSVQRGYDDAMSMFAPAKGRRRKPTGLICTSLHVAIGARMALQQLDISIPEDVKIICITANQPFTREELEFTTITPSYSHIAAEAIRLLSSPKNHHWLPAHTSFPACIVQRASTSSPRFEVSDMEEPEEGFKA